MTQINQEEVFSLVDELRMMASPKNGLSAAELGIEFESAEERKALLQSELDELNSIPAEIYLETQTQLQEKSYSVTLKREIATKKTALKAKEKELKELKNKEEIAHQNLKQAENLLSTSETKLSVLEERKAKTNDESVKAQMESSISTTNEDIVSKKSEVESKTAEYNEIQERILSLVTEIDEIKTDISNKQANVDEIEEKLSDDTKYINERKKSDDNSKIESLKTEIANLESRIVEILSDPAILADKAKKAIIEGDVTSAMIKIRELVNIASSMPYMNVTNKDSLSDERLRAESERDIFLEQIKGKSYEVKNNSLLESRISYLQKKISLLIEEKSVIQAEIGKLDRDEKYGLNLEIQAANNTIMDTKDEIAQYEELLKNTEKASEKAKIQAAYERKISDLSIAEELKTKYIQEEIKSINEANDYEDTVSKIDEEINSYEKEIKETEKLIALQSTNTKDILAEIKDYDMLEEKAATVMSIIHRGKFTHTPEEIGQKLEEQLGAVLNPIAEEKQEVIEEPVIEEVQSVEPNEEVVSEVQEVVVPVIEEEPVELVIDPVENQEEVQTIAEEDAIEYKPAFDVIDPIEIIEETVIPESNSDVVEPIEIVEDTATIEEVVIPENVTNVNDEIVITEVQEPVEDTVNLENTMISTEEIKAILDEEIKQSETVEPEIMKVTDEESVVVETPVVEQEQTDILDLSSLFQTVDSEEVITENNVLEPVIQPEEIQVVTEESTMDNEVSQDTMTSFMDFFNQFNSSQEQQLEEEGPVLGKVA